MSNRLTFSLASLIFLIALGLIFGATSVLAHEGDATHNASTSNHPLVTSFELTGDEITTASGAVGATITFAAAEDAAESDAEHNTLAVNTLATNNLIIQKWDTTATPPAYSDTDGDHLEVFRIIAGSTNADGNSNTYTFSVGVSTSGSPTEGRFRLGLQNIADLLGATDVELRHVIYYDKTGPTITVTDQGSRTLADQTAKQWRGPFDLMITVDDGETGSGFDPSATSSKATLTVIETDDAGTAATTPKVNVGPVKTSGSNYVVRITPLVATTAKTPIHFKATATDNSGNSGDSDVLSTNLASGLSQTVYKPMFTAADPLGLIAVCEGETLPTYPTVVNGVETSALLPLADHSESITVNYSFDDSLPAGLRLRTIDSQTRVIEGKPTETTADTGVSVTWRAQDMDNPNNFDTTEIKIIVKAHKVPKTPTGLTAKKLDSADLGMSTKDRVQLTWTQPDDLSSYANGCIPFPNNYVVYQTKKDVVTGEFSKTETVYDSSKSTHDSKFTRNTAGAATHFTVQLPSGTYKFKIEAKNSVGPSASKSEFATWTPKHQAPPAAGKKVGVVSNVTLDYVVVADPPGRPTDLDGAVDQDGNKITLDWLAPAVDGGDAIGALHGGFMFGGYVVYQTRDSDDKVERYPATGYLTVSGAKNYLEDRTYQTPGLASGEYVYRVAAANIAGESGQSISKKRFTIVTGVGPTDPTPPSAATTIPDKGYLVFVRDIENAPTFGTANPALAEWSAMPNLYEFFKHAPGGSLQLNVTNVAARKVVISEMMWAVDEGKVGQDGYDGQQWIEVYNNSGASILVSSISFTAKKGRPALAEGTDLISNVVGAGSLWIRTKGQNGNSGAADGSGQKEFVSMFRNNYGKVGWAGGHWTASSQIYHPNHKGTPGAGEVQDPKTFPASRVALGTVFNEIANYASGNSSHEWIELRKRSGELSNLENWVVDMVTGVDAQKRLFKIPKLSDGRYGDILLITKTDPARDDSHPLRGGYDVTKDIAAQENDGRDKNIRYYVAKDWTTDLPDNGEFVLILRHGADKTNHEKVEDLAGYHPNLAVNTATFFTNLWPLIGYSAANLSHNKINSGAVHRRAFDDIPGTKTKDGNKAGKVAFQETGWVGIGYKRNATANNQNGGTPGYPNGALAANNTKAGGDPVIISEIMYSTGNRGVSPQWIELRNTSQTAGINLDGWQLTIVNHDQDSAESADTFAGDLVKHYNLNGKIPPGETFLIVAHSGANNTNLPSERIQAIRSRRGDLILSQYGFEITLKTAVNGGSRAEVDTVGNLVDSSGTARIRNSPQSYETPEWMLPSGMTEDGLRVSIVRVRNLNGKYVNGMDGGKLQGSWKSFDMSAQSNSPESTYYGNRSDLSNPGYTYGGVLPVSLSRFRPQRLDDGSVAIRWITESETNNAGFNILRGEALDSEFTKLNTKLIKGQGTTSERTAYEFTDTSAKPNVVYYYQIQDVSLDGDVETIRTSRLRGHVSAAGKAATTWGELKALQ